MDPLHTNLRVLIIDDNSDAAEMIAQLLTLKGHVVSVAFDGPSGIREAELFRPDIVFLDIEMPGMNGFDVASTFRQMDALTKAKVIALTGSQVLAPEDFNPSWGFNFYVRKPAPIATLLNAIATVIAQDEVQPGRSHESAKDDVFNSGAN